LGRRGEWEWPRCLFTKYGTDETEKRSQIRKDVLSAVRSSRGVSMSRGTFTGKIRGEHFGWEACQCNEKRTPTTLDQVQRRKKNSRREWVEKGLGTTMQGSEQVWARDGDHEVLQISQGKKPGLKPGMFIKKGG